jgi:hypothetical protein
MIEFRPLTACEQFLRLIWPPYRRREEAAMEDAIRRLVDDPALPCVIDGRVVPNGYGAE